MAKDTTTKGPGLARGPALIVGTILLAFALLAVIKHNAFPTFGDNFPDGKAVGTKFLVFEVNGWTNWLLAATGGLLLFGSAQHLMAKTMSLIVGLVLGAAAVIALLSGDILGLGASNFFTWLGMGVAAVVLLLNVFAPRLDRDKDDGRDDDDRDLDRSDAIRERALRRNGRTDTGRTERSDAPRGGSVAAD